jgi:hypothetical protein
MPRWAAFSIIVEADYAGEDEEPEFLYLTLT